MIAGIFALARLSALCGGIILVAVMLLVVVSVSGRALVWVGLGPVPGDFELVEIATATAVFLFMPWCYLRGAHASVDVLFNHFAQWLQKALLLAADLLMLALWLVLTQRLYLGMLEKKEYAETTFILMLPLWWGYVVCVVAAVIGCLAYLAQTLIQLGLARTPAGWSTPTTTGH